MSTSSSCVALLAEGVDRNCTFPGPTKAPCGVALLAEGVDRNRHTGDAIVKMSWSPSSRRAWIEIIFAGAAAGRYLVALLAEGVDRNWCSSFSMAACRGRPPRGGRG